MYPGYGTPQYSYVATAATTAVSATGAIFNSITIGETAASTIIIYDEAAAAGTIVATLKASIAEGTYKFDVVCTTGIVVITAGEAKFTVAYTPIA